MYRPPLRSGLVGCLLLLTAFGARAPAAQPGTLDVSGTTVGAPTAALPLFGSTPGACTLAADPEPYAPTPFTVTPNGSYAVDVVEPISTIPGTDDTVLLVYEGTFDPADACAHFVGIGNATAGSGLTVTLAAATDYVLVVAGFYGTEDAFTVRITGPDGSTVSRGGSSEPPVCLPSEFEQTVDRASRRILLAITDAEGIARVDFTNDEGTPVLENLTASSPQMRSDDGVHFEPNDPASPPVEVAFTLQATADRGRYFARIENACGVETVIDPETDFTTGNEEGNPVAFGVEQNYPNPFSGRTALTFSVAEAGPVRVAVYDYVGREVAVLHDGPLGAAVHTVVWDGSDQGGRPVASGTYLYRVEAGSHMETRRMTLLRP